MCIRFRIYIYIYICMCSQDNENYSSLWFTLVVNALYILSVASTNTCICITTVTYKCTPLFFYFFVIEIKSGNFLSVEGHPDHATRRWDRQKLFLFVRYKSNITIILCAYEQFSPAATSYICVYIWKKKKHHIIVIIYI